MASDFATTQPSSGNFRERTYGIRLAAILDDQGLSIQDLCAKVAADDGSLADTKAHKQLSYTAAALILKGTTKTPQPETRERIAAALGVAEDVWLQGTFAELLTRLFATSVDEDRERVEEDRESVDRVGGGRLDAEGMTADQKELHAAATARQKRGPPMSEWDFRTLSWLTESVGLGAIPE